MSEDLLYQERLPKHVFKGTQFQRRSIKIVQWWYRLGAAAIFLGTMYLAISPKPEHDFAPVWVGIIAAWIGCATILNISERRHQAQLDGSIRTIIYDDRVAIPPRLRRKLTGEPNFIFKDKIDRVKITRGWGNQYIAKRNGVLWEDAPIGLKIVTKSGKKIGLGYKPPSTVKEITDVITKHWDVRVEDPGSGMGRGTRYIKDKVVGEYSYDEIMKMNLFEWQE